jgi:hypothetical protein
MIGYRSYAVRVQTGHFTQWTSDSPAAAWYVFPFSQNFCTMCKNFVKKKGIFRPAGGESGRLFRQMPDLELTA